MQTISDQKAFPAGSNRIVKIKRQRFFWPLLLAIFFLSAGSSYGQNISRMNSGVNTQTVSPYTVVCSDALKLVILNSASAFAVNLPSAATCGTGYVFQLKNLGAGLVTITPLFGNIDGSSSITLVTGSGVDIYNDGTNYFTQSGKGSFTNPMSILGDLITENSTPAAARLPGPTGPNGVPQVLTNTPSGGLSGANLWGPPGLAERDVTGTTATDTIASTDCNPKAVFYQGSVAVAVTLPTATTLAVPNCVFSLTNITTGSSTAVTVTPTTWTVTPGGSSLVIAQGQSCRFSVDNAVATQWDAVCHDLQLTAGSNITITRGQYGPTIAASGGGAFPITVSGTVTSGGIPYFNSTTQESSSALLTLNVLVKGGGAGGAPANSSITDNGTTVTTNGEYHHGRMSGKCDSLRTHSSGNSVNGIAAAHQFCKRGDRIHSNFYGSRGCAGWQWNDLDDLGRERFGNEMLDRNFGRVSIVGNLRRRHDNLSGNRSGHGKFRRHPIFQFDDTGIFFGLANLECACERWGSRRCAGKLKHHRQWYDRYH